MLITKRNESFFMKKILSVLAVVIIALTSLSFPTFAYYNGQAAANYAKAHYETKNYNTNYNNYTGKGGDCTNFISQCVKAGGKQMSYYPNRKAGEVKETKTYWYSQKYTVEKSFLGIKWKTNEWAESTSWVRVAGGYGFYNYWNNKVKCTEYRSLDQLRKNAAVGDVIQVRSVKSSGKTHSTIVGEKLSNGEIVLYYHTNDTCKKLAAFNEAFGDGSGNNIYTLFKFTQS